MCSNESPYQEACTSHSCQASPRCWLCRVCLRLPARVKPSTALLLAHEQHLAVYKTFLQSFALGTGCYYKTMLDMEVDTDGARFQTKGKSAWLKWGV